MESGEPIQVMEESNNNQAPQIPNPIIGAPTT